MRDGRETESQRTPVVPAVSRFEDAAGGAGKRSVLHEALLLLPQSGINNVGIPGIDAHVVTAGVFVLEQHLIEGGATIGGAEDSALGVGAVWMSQDGDKEPFGVSGIHIDVGDHLRIAESQVSPRLSAVGGSIYAVAGGEVRAYDSRAGTDVDGVGIGRRHGDRANRAGGFVIEAARPGGALIAASPDAAIVEPDIRHVGMAGGTRNSPCASGPRRTDGAPVHLGIQLGVERLGRRPRRQWRQYP